MKTSLTTKIKEVIEDGDTSKDIVNKITKKYPEITERKIEQRGGQKEGEIQLQKEIASRLFAIEGQIVEIDRNEKENKYYIINTDEEEKDEDKTNIINDDIGYVYILDTHLRNEDINDVIWKIGKAKDVQQRIKQLNGETSSYSCKPHSIIKTFKVYRPFKVEKAIHCALDFYRVNPKKEGFYSTGVIKKMSLIELIIEDFLVK